MTVIDVEPVLQGYNYTLLIGAEPDGNGMHWPGSADTIVKGWAPTEAKAEALAQDALERRVDA